MGSFRKLAALLLAVFMIAACAACAEKQQDEPEEEQQIAGADWRTWGWVNDAGSVTHGGKTSDVLVCVFTDEIDLYLDDETQTLYAAASYPETIDDAREAYAGCSLDDRNGDGESDLQAEFVRSDGEKRTLTWYWEAEKGFVYQEPEE